MNPNDPLHDALKKLEAPHLPQQGINSFLNEALKKANTGGNFAAISSDLTKRIASMTFAADWSRQLLRSFEPPKSPFQKIIYEAATAAAVNRNLSSFTDTIAKAASSRRTTADVFQELLRSVQLRKSSTQLALDAGRKAALQFNLRNLEHISELSNTVSKLGKIYSSPAFDGISQGIQQAMSVSHLWQSSQVTGFATRIFQETDFRDAFIK